jgi:hypothetical protein
LIFISMMSLASAWDPDANRNFTAMCEGHGYAVETHEVTTEDGYILTVFRIAGKLAEAAADKPAVFM